MGRVQATRYHDVGRSGTSIHSRVQGTSQRLPKPMVYTGMGLSKNPVSRSVRHVELLLCAAFSSIQLRRSVARSAIRHTPDMSALAKLKADARMKRGSGQRARPPQRLAHISPVGMPEVSSPSGRFGTGSMFDFDIFNEWRGPRCRKIMTRSQDTGARRAVGV